MAAWAGAWIIGVVGGCAVPARADESANEAAANTIGVASVPDNAPQSARAQPAAEPVELGIYVVAQPGDTLQGLAQRHACTVAKLLAWNHLKPGAQLQPGQPLRVAPLDASRAVIAGNGDPPQPGPSGLPGRFSHPRLIASPGPASAIAPAQPGAAQVPEGVARASEASAAVPASALPLPPAAVMQAAQRGRADVARPEWAWHTRRTWTMDPASTPGPNLPELSREDVPAPASPGKAGGAVAAAIAYAGPGAAVRGCDTPATQATPGAVCGSLAWPLHGRVVESWRPGHNRGIGIAGKAGEAVRAAADGRVIYAGAGLNGYGSLILVQHNAHLLTAYAHSGRLRVRSGDVVKRGQELAELDAARGDSVALMFEVRRDGLPVDPMGWLASPG
ncbi:hypothetical protein R75461_07886 [Paraburkholderia nemoris]|uniref:peptidoglycan DD-metalloendopeptidase family protein n=1 Tax=Paraburkholderia nemoris TaxID=2793076 RepID=UPI00190E2D90|nr:MULTISPECIES: peptidoglycan DD-metalloendopeptidase family protein [Paraburkholderia]MBK3786918.1 peptidoglycan DD-metalloendopeptidase family protein [Paraburkholderia aspalathi]CAE6859053.1 hypothetical protein R75461_07886 [Paraburkholderia nemoris]